MAWSTLIGSYKVFGMGGMAQRLECDQNSYNLQSFHCYSHVSICGDSIQNRYFPNYKCVGLVQALV